MTDLRPRSDSGKGPAGMHRGHSHLMTLFSVVLTVAFLGVAFPVRAHAASGQAPRKESAAGPASRQKGQKSHRNTVNKRLNRAAASASANIAQSGVQCEEHEPPAAVQACVGKNAGDVCTVTHEDHGFTGQCAATPRGILVCQPPIPPPPPPSAVAACENKMAGDECQIAIHDDDDDDEGDDLLLDDAGDQDDDDDGDDDGHAVNGICRAFASGVVACVPISTPLQRLIDACEGIAAGEPCSFMHDDETVNGTCTALESLGGLVVCVPEERIPPAVTACADKAAGDTCSYTKGDETISGTCVNALLNGDILVCRSQPPATMDPCADKSAGDACTIPHDDETVSGLCVAVPFLGGMLVCVPERLIPPPVTACEGRNAGDMCSFSHDGRTVEGNCATLPDHGILVCQPPPPQAFIDACIGKVAGDACSVMLHDRAFTGACETAPDGTTLACMPQKDHEPSPRVAACVGKEAGALCTVQDEDDDDGDDDGDDDDVKRGLCRPNDEGVLACLPPAPPQEAVDACSGLMVGDMCSFPWGHQILSGTCRALPGVATLVCAPLCPDNQNGQR